VIDLHTHILPGIDDGARDLDESIEMCRIAANDGIKTIVATPHTGNGLYLINREHVLSEVALLNQKLAEFSIPVNILPGTDVHIGTYFDVNEMLEHGEAITVTDNNCYMMVEFSQNFIASNFNELLFKLKSRGITPIFTHPERNIIIQEDMDVLFDWIEKGGLVQLTAMSLTGYFGRSIKRFSEELLTSNLVHFIASDAHSTTGRPPVLSTARDVAASLIGADLAFKLVDEYPSDIINGRAIVVPEPVPKKPGFFSRFFVK
jgi:protein-tyrosine phosphatase